MVATFTTPHNLHGQRRAWPDRLFCQQLEPGQCTIVMTPHVLNAIVTHTVLGHTSTYLPRPPAPGSFTIASRYLAT